MKGQRRRLLVVEDEPLLRVAISDALRQEGWTVDVAEDGEEGLYKATTWGYDAIVLDVMLPKKDGWEILRELRRSRAVPVIMLTARDTVEDRVRGLDGGADDYLVKPFELEELLARLRALIRRAAGESHPAIRSRITGFSSMTSCSMIVPTVLRAVESRCSTNRSLA